MKNPLKKCIVIFSLASMLILLIVGTVFAASKNYHDITTVYYINTIADIEQQYWNPRYNDYTSPSHSMDQFGINFWSAYCSCNGNPDWSSYTSYSVSEYPFLMRYDQTSIFDSMAKTKTDCGVQTLAGHNYIQHWWQDSGQPGDGGNINQVQVMTNP